VIIVLHRKTFIATLVEVPATGCVVELMVPFHMSIANPPNISRKVATPGWSNN
jgi:hypothetical protein